MPIQSRRLFTDLPVSLGLLLARNCSWGVGGVSGFLKAEMWGIKSGCRGLTKGQKQARVEGVSCWGRAGLWFTTQLHSHVPEQSTSKTPGARLGERKVSSRVGLCCAWWWQWHWQWWGDNMAASSCVGGDSEVRKEVDFSRGSANRLLRLECWSERSSFNLSASLRLCSLFKSRALVV